MNKVIFNTKNFTNDQFTTAWTYLTDKNNQPCHGEIKIFDDHIECISVEKSFSLNALLVIPKFGKIILRTAIVKPRKNKYDLLKELIRGRVYQIEFELTKLRKKEAKKYKKRLEVIRKTNVEKTKLSKLLFLGEKIVFKTASKNLRKRIAEGETKDFLIGGQAFGIEKGGKYKRVHNKTFNLGIAPLYFFLLKGDSKNKIDWTLTDKIVNWLVATKRLIKGHPLVWLHKYARPDWMLDLTFNELKEFLIEHVTLVVNRYKDRIQMWDIVNEMPAEDANGFDLNNEQLLEITKLISDLVKKLQPEAERIINFSEIFGAHSFVQNKPSIPPVHFLKLCDNKGIEYEAIGLQFYMGMKKEFTCRELLDISQTIDAFCQFGKTIHFSELGWPSQHAVDPDCFFSSDHPEVAGRWHREWSEDLQAEFLAKIYTIFASKPKVKSITWWDITDNGKFEDIGSRFIPFSGLTRRDFSAKPALEKLKKFKKMIKTI